MKECSICREEKELKKYYSQNKAKSNGERYVYRHPECKECTKKKSVKWQNENKDKRKLINHRYSVSDKGKSHFYKYGLQYRKDGRKKEWDQNNKNKLKKYRINRKMNKKHEISEEEWSACKKFFNFKCTYCGISEEEHRKLHSQQLHREHVDPNGKSDLSNCIPSCKSCNCKKHIETVEDWYKEGNPQFNNLRINKINKWLNEEYLLFI